MKSFYMMCVVLLLPTLPLCFGVPPENVVITSTTTDEIEVTWEDPNGNTTEYRLRCSCDAEGCSEAHVTINPPTTEGTCTDLTPGTEYKVTVSAVVDGVEYATDPPTTGYTAAAAPTDFEVTTVSDTALKVMWTPPAGNCGNISITYKEKNSGEDPAEKVKDCEATEETLSGLSGNGQYTVTIKTIHPDDEGDDSEVTTQEQWTLPSQVTDLAPSSPSPKEITVGWNFPADNIADNKLTYYVLKVVDKYEGGTKCVQQITFSEDGTKTGPDGDCTNKIEEAYESDQSVSYKVESLDPCSPYTFTVYANNEEGNGAADDTDGDTTVGEPTSPVTITKVTNNTHSVELEWERPADPERCEITSSLITYTYKNCEDMEAEPIEKTQEVTGDATSVTVPDLQPHWKYTFTVESNTSAGAGQSESEEQDGTTLETAPTGPPTNVQTGTVTHEGIDLIWDPPELCERNGEITGYNVSWTYKDPKYPENPGRGGSGSKEVTDGEAYTIDAKPYKDYTISIAAMTSKGTGPVEVMDIIQTEEWHAGQVDASTVVLDPSDPYSLKVSWEEPYESRGVIIKYTVRINSLPGGPCDTYGQLKCADVKNVTDVSTRSTTFSGLQPYQEFEVFVKAWTSVGAGDESDARVAETAVALPYKPTDVQPKSLTGTLLRVTWTAPEHYPGPTYYTVYVRDTVEESESKDIPVIGYDNTTVEVPGLSAYWDYEVTVTAETTEGRNDSQSKDITMHEAPPNAVEEFIVDKEEDMCTEPMLEVLWTILEGRNRNGEILNYTVKYWKVGDDESPMYKRFSEDGEVDDKGQRVELLTSADGIETHYEYKFEMRAYNSFEGAANTLDRAIDAGACPPKLPGGEEIGNTKSSAATEASNQSGINRETAFRITIDPEFYNDESNGEITKRGVYVMQLEEATGRTEIVDEEDLLSVTYLQAFEDRSRIQPYRIDLVLPQDQAETKRSTGPVEIVIGEDEQCYDDHRCNGQLIDGRKYKIRVFVCTGAGCTVTAPSDQEFSTDKNMADVIVGAVIGTLIFIAFVVLIMVMLIRWDMIPFGKSRDRQESFGTPMVDVPIAPPQDPFRPPRPVPIGEFVQHVTELHRNSNFGFADEYQKIKDHCAQKSTRASELPANRAKNRYTNVLPFDDTRVKLKPYGDEEGSDYINGNFMMGYTSQREYLAMQEPLPSTVDDFWRAIWEQNCPIIVMIANCLDRHRVMQWQYWPDKAPDCQMYGDIQVTLLLESHLGDYVIRILEVKRHTETRTIKQFHFISWPDNGCPDTTNQLLTFVKEMRGYIRPDSSESLRPILVHCRAGVGLTGVFIVVDRVLQHMRQHDEIDIFGIVMEMRENRCHMVQTEEQYVFIHDCISDAIKQGLNGDASEHVYCQLEFKTDDTENKTNTYELII